MDYISHFFANLNKTRLRQFFKGAIGMGVQWRRIFNLQWTPTADQSVVQPTERLRSFVELRFEGLFDPDNERWDRMHRFDFGGRYYFGQAVGLETGTRQYGWIYERYQRSIKLGWHDQAISLPAADRAQIEERFVQERAREQLAV